MVIQSTTAQGKMPIQDLDGLLTASIGSALLLTFMILLTRFIISGDLFLYYRTLVRPRQLMVWLTTAILLLAARQ
jgi:hypothetical protein